VDLAAGEYATRPTSFPRHPAEVPAVVRRLVYSLLVVLAAVFPALVPSGTPAQTGGGVVVYNGLEFMAFGGASAAPDTGGGGSTTPCCLTISNIGSSGKDGVCMEPGPSQGAWTAFELPDPDTTTAVVIITGLTALGSNLNTPFVSMTLTNAAGTQAAETDWSFIGSLARRVEVWNDGMPVAQFSGVVGPVAISETPVSVGMAVDGMPHPLPDPMLPASAPEPLRPYANARFPAATTFGVGSPPVVVTGDELRVFPEDPTSYPTNLSLMEMRFQVDRAMVPATVRLTDAALRHFGRMHRGRGDAVLKVDSTQTLNGELDITIPNTNGDGAVSLSIGADNLGPAPGATGDDDCLIWDIKTSDPGVVDRFALHGTLASASAAAAAGTTGTWDTELVALDLVGDGSQWLATPDFNTVDPAAPKLTLKNASGAKLLEVPAFSGSYTVVGTDLPVELGAMHNDHIGLVHAYAFDRDITVPGHGTFFASRVELSSVAGVAAVASYTRLTREWQNMSSGVLGVKVEKSQFKQAELNNIAPAGARTTDDAFATAGYDHLVFHSDNDLLAPGSNGLIVFNGADLFDGGPAGGVSWVPLGPANSPGSAEIDFVEVGGGGAENPPEGMKIRLVSNGSGADMFVDPGLTGITEVEVIVRDAQGSVKVKFPWLSFSQPLLALPDYPTSAGMHRLQRGTKSSTWLSLGYEADLLIGGPTASGSIRGAGGPTASAAAHGGSGGADGRVSGSVASTPLTKAELIEVIYDATPTTGPDPDFAIRAQGVPAIVFTGEDPNPVGVLTTPRAYTTMNLPYPNPFNPQTTLSFELRQAGNVSLRIYNIEGRYVATVHSGPLSAGPHAFTWDGRNRQGSGVASGVYFAELRAPDGVHHAKLNLLK
jgi:hypothetical protein